MAVAAGTPQQRVGQQQEQGGLSGMPGSASGPPVTPSPARRESMSLASMLKKQKASRALALICMKPKSAGQLQVHGWHMTPNKTRSAPPQSRALSLYRWDIGVPCEQ